MPSPCQCCTPTALSPKGAFVKITGFKNSASCIDCEDLNKTYAVDFSPGGCGYVGYVTSSCGVELSLDLGSDPNDSNCRVWQVTIYNNDLSLNYVFSKGGLKCCFGKVDLEQDSATDSVCDTETGGITVEVTPFGEWSTEDLSTSCLPAIAQSCEPPATIYSPQMSSSDQGFAAGVEPSCDTCGDGMGPQIPEPKCGANCSDFATNVSSGNIAARNTIPTSDPTAPLERLVYNSAPAVNGGEKVQRLAGSGWR